MQYLTQLIEAVRNSPGLGVVIVVAVIAIAVVLNRKPRIQRDADARLAAIRRDKADQYNKQRPLR
jgi:hypothetical protein